VCDCARIQKVAGAGVVNGLIIAVNIVASIAVDHFGHLNTPVHEANVYRVLGRALMVGGIAVVSRF
jgi:bacterial/archaeal transporter family-2 protein